MRASFATLALAGFAFAQETFEVEPVMYVATQTVNEEPATLGADLSDFQTTWSGALPTVTKSDNTVVATASVSTMLTTVPAGDASMGNFDTVYTFALAADSWAFKTNEEAQVVFCDKYTLNSATRFFCQGIAAMPMGSATANTGTLT